MAWLKRPRSHFAITCCRVNHLMPSERHAHRRLHPSAIVFASAAQLKAVALPLVLAVFGANRYGGSWFVIAAVFLGGTLLSSLLQYLAFRYRFEASELVVRKGVLFRSERHIPYARIQSLDVTQNVLHRLLGVVAVRVQTGAGNEPEAVLSALRRDALDEMRARVFEQRAAEHERDEIAAPAHRELLALPLRELVITGLVELRGIALIAAGVGVLWEIVIEPMLDGLTAQPRILRVLIAWFRGDVFDPLRIAAAIGAALVIIGGLSILWAIVRLYGFRLRDQGDDLQAEYGLLTRVTHTIPRRRIQSLTLRQGLLHRLFGRIAVEVETAGGAGGDGKSETERTRIAPVLRPEALPALLEDVAPDLRLDALAWQPLAPRTTRRVFKRSVMFAAVVAALSTVVLGTWALAVFGGLVALGALHARAYVRHARWALDDTVVAFRHGWLWRRTTVARLAKVQVVTVRESPFDRRAAMARLGIDTAGATVAIPYLPRETAMQLHATLAIAASQTEFRW
jgi:putative membrane protein